MARNIIKIEILLLVVFSFSLTANGQVTIIDKTISRIKATQESKDKLLDRFKAFAQSEIEKNYEKQFESISPRLIRSEDCKIFYSSCFAGKDNFIKHQQARGKYWGNITEIVLSYSQKKLDKKKNQLLFSVHFKLGDGKDISPIYLDVFFDNEQWYFSTFYTVDI